MAAHILQETAEYSKKNVFISPNVGCNITSGGLSHPHSIFDRTVRNYGKKFCVIWFLLVTNQYLADLLQHDEKLQTKI